MTDILDGHDCVDESDERFGYLALGLLRRLHMRERQHALNVAFRRRSGGGNLW